MEGTSVSACAYLCSERRKTATSETSRLGVPSQSGCSCYHPWLKPRRVVSISWMRGIGLSRTHVLRITPVVDQPSNDNEPWCACSVRWDFFSFLFFLLLTAAKAHYRRECVLWCVMWLWLPSRQHVVCVGDEETSQKWIRGSRMLGANQIQTKY